jgi:hypothetical protein
VSAAGLLLSVSLAATAAGDATLAGADLLDRAEAAFRAGVSARQNSGETRRCFREAASHYETLRQRGADNADLEGNLGNAYLLAGDLARAILAYRRGLRLNPGDPVLRANLAYARGQVLYPEPGNFGRPRAEQRLPWLPRLAPGISIVCAVALYALAWLALTRWWMIRRSWSLAWGATALALSGLFAAEPAMEAGSRRQESAHPLLVVASDGVYLRKGNGLSYPRRCDQPLNRGVEARLLFQRGDWLQIELAGGEVGWVPSTKVLFDAAPSSMERLSFAAAHPLQWPE